MTRTTICFATAALLVALASTASAQHRLIAPYPPSTGCVVQPRLGINGQMLFGHGMYVNYVAPGTTAHWMGLEYGDIIVRINNRHIHSQFDYSQALQQAAYYNGGRVVLLVDNVRTRNPYFPGSRFGTVVGQLNTGFGQPGLRLSARPVWP